MPRSEFGLLVSYKTASSTPFAQPAPVSLVRAVFCFRAVTGLSVEVLQPLDLEQQQSSRTTDKVGLLNTNGIQTALRRRMPGTNTTGLGGHVGLATGTRYARGVHGARRFGRVAGV